jgi:small-conductance mechanosensitive channel
MITSYNHTLIAVENKQLSKLVNLAIENGISIQIVDNSNFEQADDIISEIRYNTSNEEWNGSSC